LREEEGEADYEKVISKYYSIIHYFL
jgi:hypothetical protein